MNSDTLNLLINSKAVDKNCYQLLSNDKFPTPLLMGFSRKEYWNGLPFPSPGELADPEIEPESPAKLPVRRLTMSLNIIKATKMSELWQIS